MNITIPKNASGAVNTNFFFVVDLSASMTGSIDDLKATLLATSDLVNLGDTFSLAYFSSAGDYRWICKGTTVQGAGLKASIDREIYARGLTCFTEVLASLPQTVEDVSTLTGITDNVLFFLTDGHPNDRSPSTEVIRLAMDAAKCFSQKRIVGYSRYYNRELLLEMATVMNGVFNHVSSFSEMSDSCNDVVKLRVVTKVIPLEKCYDVIWQVSDTDTVALKCVDKTVTVFKGDSVGELYALDFTELDTLDEESLLNARFVYSLACVLSQMDKANLGVKVLRKARALQAAKCLQKAFTVTQRGEAENELKALAQKGGDIDTEQPIPSTSLEEFLSLIRDRTGKTSIVMSQSPYKSISKPRKSMDVVKYTYTDDLATVVGITGNENRANVSFLTTREGIIDGVIDASLQQRIDEYNQNTSTPILFPIRAQSFRNLAFIANGDFNYDKITLFYNAKYFEITPQTMIDLFPNDQKTITISDFTRVSRMLIVEKAKASVFRMYLKVAQGDTSRHDDQRARLYGEGAVDILKDMGLDYAMRYSAPKASQETDNNTDFIPFLEITTALKGAATISASTSYTKRKKGGKPNVGDDITWPLFDHWDTIRDSVEPGEFLKMIQVALKGTEQMVDVLSQNVSTQKFYMMATNSWFNGIDKADEVEYDGVLIKAKIVNVYI